MKSGLKGGRVADWVRWRLGNSGVPYSWKYFEKYPISPKTYLFLSNDVTIIQWITSCHKNGITTRVITLWRVDVTCNVKDNANVNNAFSCRTYGNFVGDLIPLKGHMINIILHPWSLPMKFMKVAEGSFINFIWNDNSCKTLYLSYDVAVMLWIMSCHMNRMATHVIIF